MHDLNSQVAPASASIDSESTLRKNRELLGRLRKIHKVRGQTSEDTSFKTSSRGMVRYFLSALGPVPAESGLSNAKDMANLRKAISSIMKAAEDDVLTEKEADAVIDFISLKFVERRFDDVLKDIATPRSRGWFVLGKRALNQRD